MSGRASAGSAELIANDLIAEINDFDAAKIIAEAKTYKAR